MSLVSHAVGWIPLAGNVVKNLGKKTLGFPVSWRQDLRNKRVPALPAMRPLGVCLMCLRFSYTHLIKLFYFAAFKHGSDGFSARSTAWLLRTTLSVVMTEGIGMAAVPWAGFWQMKGRMVTTDWLFLYVFVCFFWGTFCNVLGADGKFTKEAHGPL